MEKYKVQFTVELPEGIPFDEVEEFIEFELGQRGDMTIHHNALKMKTLQNFKVRSVDVREA